MIILFCVVKKITSTVVYSDFSEALLAALSALRASRLASLASSSSFDSACGASLDLKSSCGAVFLGANVFLAGAFSAFGFY